MSDQSLRNATDELAAVDGPRRGFDSRPPHQPGTALGEQGSICMNGKIKAVGGRVWASRLGKIVVAGFVVVAVGGGGAVAATTLAAPNSVDTAAIQDGAVTYPKIGLNSVASSRIQDGGVAWPDLAVDSVSGYKVKDGTIAEPDLSAGVVAKLNAPDGDVNGASTLKAAYNNVTVENVGGSWLTRKTDLGSFTLPAGTWVINASAKFSRTVADETDPLYQTRPQLAVRAFPTEANPFGQDFGTVMNTIAPYVNADMFGSDSKRVVLTGETTFTVAAFGYQDNRGSDDSGKIKLVNATVFVQQG